MIAIFMRAAAASVAMVCHQLDNWQEGNQPNVRCFMLGLMTKAIQRVSRGRLVDCDQGREQWAMGGRATNCQLSESARAGIPS